MITSIFKKSTPINYSLVGILMFFFFFFYQFKNVEWTKSIVSIGQTIGLFAILSATLFFVNFIAKKNNLTKASSYAILFFMLFMLLFPSIFKNANLIISNFFIVLAMRRLISLQTLNAPKEKIFDASMWIFVASMFHFWAILFILLVYISIIFNVSRDYRNWLLPIVAFFTAIILFVFYDLLIDNTAIDFYLSKTNTSFQLDYFTNNYQNIAFSIFAVFVAFFVVPSVFSLANKPLNLQTSFKKVYFAFFIGLSIFAVTSNKSNEMLVYTFLPLAIMATNSIEFSNNRWMKEIVLFITISASMFCYFSQL